MNRDLEIVDQILREGEEEANAILEDAKLRAKRALDDSKLKAKEYADSRVLSCRKKAKVDFENQKEIFGIERKHIFLEAKAEIVDAIFARAEQKLANLSPEKTRKFIEGVVSKFAEAGDEVLLSAKDRSERFWLENSTIFAQKKLRLADENGDFTGGVVIRNQRVNKIFTFSSLLRDEKEEILSELAKRLFD